MLYVFAVVVWLAMHVFAYTFYIYRYMFRGTIVYFRLALMYCAMYCDTYMLVPALLFSPAPFASTIANATFCQYFLAAFQSPPSLARPPSPVFASIRLQVHHPHRCQHCQTCQHLHNLHAFQDQCLALPAPCPVLQPSSGASMSIEVGHRKTYGKPYQKHKKSRQKP